MIATNVIAKWIVKAAAWITPGTVGVTIWPFIFIWPAIHERNSVLVAHERVHIAQWERYWVIGFPFVYLYQFIRYGYRKMPLEKEAYGYKKV